MRLEFKNFDKDSQEDKIEDENEKKENGDNELKDEDNELKDEIINSKILPEIPKIEIEPMDGQMNENNEICEIEEISNQNEIIKDNNQANEDQVSSETR